MNIIGDNDESKKTDKNKLFLVSFLIIGVLIMMILMMLVVVRQKIAQANISGIIINNKLNKQLKLDNLIIEEDTIFFPIKDTAECLGYKSYNGEYKIQTEDTDKCYILNDNESVSFFEGSNYVYKINLNNDTSDKNNTYSNSNSNTNVNQNYEKYEIEYPVKNVNNKLYVSADGLSIACNLSISADQNKQKIQIYTLDQIEENVKSIVSQKNVELGNNGNFENRKAILQGWIIVQDSNKNYGIINDKGDEILGLKYKNIQYNDYTKSFMIEDSSKKINIWNIEDNQPVMKTKKGYDTIELIDKSKQLYKVSLNGKNGIIDFEGNNVTGMEYDEIGLDITKYSLENNYIVYDNLIPVKKNDKWGVINNTGKTVIPIEYDDIGCIQDKSANLENIALVNEYGLFVLKKGDKYGLTNWEGQQIIGFSLSSVYFSNETGEKRAYMEADGKKYDIVKYLDDNGTIKKYEQEKQEDSQWDF